jgi:hypothetical protein
LKDVVSNAGHDEISINQNIEKYTTLLIGSKFDNNSDFIVSFFSIFFPPYFKSSFTTKLRVWVTDNKPQRIESFDDDNDNIKIIKDLNVLILLCGFKGYPKLSGKVVITLNNNNGIFLGTVVNAVVNIDTNYVIKSIYDKNNNENVFSIHDKKIDRSNRKMLITGEGNINIECDQQSTEILLISTKPFSIEFNNKNKVVTSLKHFVAYKYSYPEPKEEEIPIKPTIIEEEEKPVQEEEPESMLLETNEEEEQQIHSPIIIKEVVKQPDDDSIVIPGYHHHHFRLPHIHKAILDVIKEDDTIKSSIKSSISEECNTIKSSISEECNTKLSAIVEDKIKGLFTDKVDALLSRRLDHMTNIQQSKFNSDFLLLQKKVDQLSDEVKSLKQNAISKDIEYMAHINVLKSNQITTNSPYRNTSFYTAPIPYYPLNQQEINIKKRPGSPLVNDPQKKRKT